MALCDEGRAVQILGNLLSNASKYSPHGGRITIGLALSEQEGFVRVAVADTGVGIAPDEQRHVFTPFFRARSAGQSGARGIGLGLYITRLLVEIHGGQIWFESAINGGTTFFVTFPTAS
jgi:signal transduction histidine kinase